jgi:hypothetical protein
LHEVPQPASFCANEEPTTTSSVLDHHEKNYRSDPASSKRGAITLRGVVDKRANASVLI